MGGFPPSRQSMFSFTVQITLYKFLAMFFSMRIYLCLNLVQFSRSLSKNVKIRSIMTSSWLAGLCKTAHKHATRQDVTVRQPVLFVSANPILIRCIHDLLIREFYFPRQVESTRIQLTQDRHDARYTVNSRVTPRSDSRTI